MITEMQRRVLEAVHASPFILVGTPEIAVVTGQTADAASVTAGELAHREMLDQIWVASPIRAAYRMTAKGFSALKEIAISTAVDHLRDCTEAQAAVVVDGSADAIIVQMTTAGWGLDDRVDYVAGKCIRFLVPPADTADTADTEKG